MAKKTHENLLMIIESILCNIVQNRDFISEGILILIFCLFNKKTPFTLIDFIKNVLFLQPDCEQSIDIVGNESVMLILVMWKPRKFSFD